MPVAFRAVGARLKADIATAAATQSVAMPAGHLAGDLLLLVIVTDDNTGPTATPSGWALLGVASAGQSLSWLAPRVKTRVYYRVAAGTVPSASVTFSKAAWPGGSPFVLAFTAAYSGVDTAGPIEKWSAAGTSDTAAAQAHPQLTTVADGDWLLTLRTGYALAARTVTASGGTNSERVDDTDAAGGLVAALYDSAAALTPGAQAQRTTTTAGGDAICQGGSTVWSLAVKPVTTAVYALPGTALVTATAGGATVAAQPGGWDLCTPDGLPVYEFGIDWGDDGTPNDVTTDILGDITANYGRDQDRQLAPAAVGSASFSLDNTDRTYSPENTAGPLYGELDPAKTMTGSATFNGVEYPLFHGRIDDYDVHADFSDRSASFTFLDGLSSLAGVKLSTGVYAAMRTGDLVNTVLDLAGWTGGRDIDPGATVVKYWWLEGTDALTAVNDLVKSEGPPSIAYAAPDGTFVFRDRHHRLLRTESRTARAVFYAGSLGECAEEPAPSGGYSFTKPFTYSHGWRDIVNTAAFDVEVREPGTALEVVWSDDSTYNLSDGQTLDITISGPDPFIDAVLPEAGVDVLTSSVFGATPLVQLSRRSGASAKLTVRAVGGPMRITRLQLRARPLTVQRTVRVSANDAGSVGRHGERSYPDGVPWAGPLDAEAIANMILVHYGRRRPTVQIRVTSQDPAHLVQILQRTISDRIRIAYGEMGLDHDFFVERVTHTIRRLNQPGKAPVHAVVLGCEQELVQPTNVFTFDQRGKGFDQGVFDLVVADSADTVFTFDDPERGQFDQGKFAT